MSRNSWERQMQKCEPQHFPIRPLLTLFQTQLPADYIELEKRVDALKAVHQKLLAVT
jgi:hypothetical protein